MPVEEKAAISKAEPPSREGMEIGRAGCMNLQPRHTSAAGADMFRLIKNS